MKSGLKKALRSIFYISVLWLTVTFSTAFVFAEDTIETIPQPVSGEPAPEPAPAPAPVNDTQALLPTANEPEAATVSEVPSTEPATASGVVINETTDAPIATGTAIPESTPVVPPQTTPEVNEVNYGNSKSSITLILDEDLKNKVFSLLDEKKKAEISNAFATESDNLEIVLNITIKNSTPPPSPIRQTTVSSKFTADNLSAVPTCNAECQKKLPKDLLFIDTVPKQTYTRPTLSTCDNGCGVSAKDVENRPEKIAPIYVKPAETLGGAIYNWNIAHLKDKEEADEIGRVWYTIPVIPGAHAGSVDFINSVAGEVIKVSDGINQFVTDTAHSYLGEKPFPSLKDMVDDPQGVIDAEIQKAQKDPLNYSLQAVVGRPLYGNYLFGQGVATGAAGTAEGLYTVYADPRSFGEGVAKLGTAFLTDPGKVVTVVGDKLGKVADESFNDTEKGLSYSGQAAFEVGSLLVPESKVKYAAEVKGLGTINKIDDVVKYSDDVLKASDEATDVNKLNKIDNVAGSAEDILPYQAPVSSSGTATISGSPVAKIEPAKLKVEEYSQPSIRIDPIPEPRDVLENSKEIIKIAEDLNKDLNQTYTNISNAVTDFIDKAGNIFTNVKPSQKNESNSKTASKSNHTSNQSKSSSSSASSSSKSPSSSKGSSSPSSATSNASKIVSSSVSSATSSASKAVSSPVSSASSSASSVVKSVSSASKAVSSAVSSVSSSASSVVKSVSSSVSSVTKAATASASSAVSSASKAVSNVTKAIKNLLKF